MIEIKECNEPLVDVKKVCPNVKVGLVRRHMKDEKKAYLRKSVAEMIRKAEKNLPKGMTFIIGDAWRTQNVQKQITKLFIRRFSEKHPSWPKERIAKEVRKYVAPVSGKFASGHMTGGAVDLRLWKDGRKVPMKSSKLSYEENAKSVQPKLPAHIRRNRELMFSALENAGLSNYSKEYWHWSFGDIQWAKRTGRKTAIYGVVKEPAKH